MTKEKIAIGELFKKRRLERNISLKEAESATSIRMNYLQAIENGEHHKLISLVYAQGFIKQYAQFLGLDGELLIKENPEAFSQPAQHEFAYGIGTLEIRDNPSAGVKWLPNAVWAGAFVLLLLAAWYVAHLLEVL